MNRIIHLLFSNPINHDSFLLISSLMSHNSCLGMLRRRWKRRCEHKTTSQNVLKMTWSLEPPNGRSSRLHGFQKCWEGLKLAWANTPSLKWSDNILRVRLSHILVSRAICKDCKTIGSPWSSLEPLNGRSSGLQNF